MKKLIAAVFCMLSTVCIAQTSADTMQQEQIQREIQQRIQEEHRQRELEDATRRPSSIQEPQAHSEHVDEGYCAVVKEIEYSGNEIFNNDKINHVISPYVSKCLTINKINEMLDTITNLYIGSGYTTSRAYMAINQDRLGDGIIEIKIFEGKVNELILNNIKTSERFMAFPKIAGKIFYLRDVEQGIEQMNRLSSNNVTMNIVPTPNQFGYSDVVLENQKGNTTSLGLNIDNSGSKDTGVWRWGLRLSQDNLLNLNDQINFGFNKSIESDSTSSSDSYTGGVSIPFRYFIFNNNFSYSKYVTSYILKQSGKRFYSLGDSYNNTFSFDYLISRGQKHKVSISAGYIYKQSENFMKVLDIKIKNNVSSRALSVFFVEFPVTLYTNRGVMYFKPGYYEGVALFGSLDDRDVTFSQKAQYKAWKGYWYYSHNFPKLNVMVTADG